MSAGVRVSERRSRLLGLDAPVVTKSELTGSLGVYAEKLAAERELFAQAGYRAARGTGRGESQALVDRAMAMVRANALMPGAATAPRAPVDGGESNGEPAEQSPGTDVGDA